MIAWITANWGLIITILFGLDQILAMIPGVEASSVFQLITGVIKGMHDKLNPPEVK